MNYFEERFGSNIIVHNYFNPGIHLDDLKLRTMYSKILEVNNNRDQPVKHKLIDKNHKIETIREIYRSCFVTIVFENDRASGFLISPILSHSDFNIVHAGLTVISRNAGRNLLGLLSLCLGQMVIKMKKKIYVTNISSTPSILENFAKFTSQTWPDPDANLIHPPKNYKTVFNHLISEYVVKYFENPEAVEVDDKRFVIRSKSQEMGFVTDLRKIARSAQFKYMNFCYAWLDYNKEEDLVQIGMVNNVTRLKIRLAYYCTKYVLVPWFERKHKSRPTQTVADSQDDNKIHIVK